LIVSNAQKPKAGNMGRAFEEFINDQKVLDNFRKSCSKEDSALIIVDLDNVVNGYPITNWMGFKVIILNKGPLVDSLKILDAYYLLKNHCNYYVLMSRKQGL
jgi:hypothetical protein